MTSTEPEDIDHEYGDGCAIYPAGYQVVQRGYGTVRIEELRAGDYYRDPAFEEDDEWLDVADIAFVDDDDVHVSSLDMHDEADLSSAAARPSRT